MDDREKFNETPGKDDFCSHLNMEDFSDADCEHTKRDCKDFKIKCFGKYHDLYGQSDILLLVELFNNFWSMCLEIYELDPARFLSALGFAWQAPLKMTKEKLDLLTDINTLLTVEKCNKYLKHFD